MCAYSYVGDQFKHDWTKQHPDWNKITNAPVTRKEFEELKKKVEVVAETLKQIKKYDEAMGQPDCEMDEKIKFIKEVCKHFGVDPKDI